MLPPAQLLMKYLLLSLGLILSIAAPSPAQEDDPFAVAALDQQNKLTVSKAEVLVDATAIAPGKPFTVTLKLTHEPGWHSYYHNDGIGISKIPNLSWTLPEGFTAGELQWPTPHRAAFVGMITYGYLDTNYFSTTITPPTDLPTGENITIDLNADWQTCQESCIDESFSKSLSIPVKAQTEPNESAQKALAAYNAEHLPSDTPEGWNISSKDDGTNITLRIEAKGQLPDDLFFFDFDGQVDPQAAQKFTAPEDGVWELIVPRNKGNDFSDKPGPILDSLYGILAAHDTLPGADRPSVWIEIPLDSKATAAPDKAAAPVVVREDTPEEIAEMAALYNSDEKINYVLLKETAKTTLWTALVGAFIGGILLNLMPCVFPVLGIKVLGFVEQAGSDPGKVRRHGLAFTAGLVASMWVLAGTILTLKFALGQEVNWGQQMGNPYFVGAIIILLFVLGLNLAGVFEIGTSLSGAGGDLQRKKGYSGSFFSGILTTLIATPCSGPFLGAAMSFTLAQPAVTAMFLFTIFALGIASPYLFLSFFPRPHQQAAPARRMDGDIQESDVLRSLRHGRILPQNIRDANRSGRHILARHGPRGPRPGHLHLWPLVPPPHLQRKTSLAWQARPHRRGRSRLLDLLRCLRKIRTTDEGSQRPSRLGNLATRKGGAPSEQRSNCLGRLHRRLVTDLQIE